MYAFDCIDKPWRRSMAFKNVKEEGMVGRVVGFQQINESNICGKVVVFSQGEHCFKDNESIATSQFWCPTKLEFSPLGFEKLEGSSVHDRAEKFQAYVHEHHSSPLVGIGEVTTFWNWDALVAMPLLVIHIM